MKSEGHEPIKLIGVIVDEVGEPRNDRSPGCAFYIVPFRLSRTPSPAWVQFFLRAWERPPRFTSMHRPGIARVVGDRVILDGTTIEEVERFHSETLKLAVDQANRSEEEFEAKSKQRANALLQKRDEHQRHVVEVASRLKFEG